MITASAAVSSTLLLMRPNRSVRHASATCSQCVHSAAHRRREEGGVFWTNCPAVRYSVLPRPPPFRWHLRTQAGQGPLEETQRHTTTAVLQRYTTTLYHNATRCPLSVSPACPAQAVGGRWTLPTVLLTSSRPSDAPEDAAKGGAWSVWWPCHWRRGSNRDTNGRDGAGAAAHRSWVPLVDRNPLALWYNLPSLVVESTLRVPR